MFVDYNIIPDPFVGLAEVNKPGIFRRGTEIHALRRPTIKQTSIVRVLSPFPGIASGRNTPTMVQRLFRLPWAYLPSNKAAVAVIASVRVVDFYQIASFQTCITLHLQYLDPGLPLADVARNVGIAQGIFTAAQIVSAPAWGIAADSIGRKAVILIGLVGTAVACVAVAFAGSFQTIVLWRLFAGAVNGTVVAARAAMSDSLPPQHRPAGFSTLVLAFHVANAVGPCKWYFWFLNRNTRLQEVVLLPHVCVS